MELECKRCRFDACEAGGEVTLTQEETMETIVPDYCPDIARIISAEGRAFLRSREVRDGKGELSGTVRVTVLCVPEGEGGIRTLEFAIPFSAESDGRVLQNCGRLEAEAEVESLETRMLNPRKMFTHCRLVLRLIGWRKTEMTAVSDLEAEPHWCIEKRQERQKAVFITGISEKDFTFTESVSLSPGQEGAAELLSSRVSAAVTESKVVGEKLIVKGLFSLSLLYRTAEGICRSTMCELPFSQIMEAENAQEGTWASVQLDLTGCDVQIDGADPEGRQLAVTVYFHAFALLRQERELTLLTDLYSTAYDLVCEAEPLQLTVFADTLVRRQTVREVLETGVVPSSVLSVTALCGAVSVSREGDTVVLRTGVRVRALYQDESGAALSAERRVEAVCQLELPQDCHFTARACCPEGVQYSLGDRGIEVRFPVDFRLEAEKRCRRACVTAARLSEDAPKDLAGAPSLVLRCLGRQDTVWDLAKRCNTTIPMILAANGLEGEGDLPRGQLLLIPRKRA